MSDAEAASATIKTPWGDAAALRDQRLHPSSGTPHADVVQSQRRRLFAASLAVVAEKGYEASTVADIIELSGVSRSAFYEHFANKEECLTAAVETLIEPTAAELAAASKDADGEAGQAVLARFVELVATERAAARVWLVELRASGERGVALADRGLEAVVETVGELLASGSGGSGDARLGRVLVAGVEKLVGTRVRRDDLAELRADVGGLWTWLASVEAPPGELAAPRRGRQRAAAFDGYTPGERIARAVAGVLSERPYLEMSTDDIAARAAISLSTFYANFSDKRDAVLGALEMSGAQIMALAVPAARRAGDWTQGVRALYEAVCAYFAAEPELAELATVGVYGAGAEALARRDRVLDSLAEMLAPGFEENPAAPAVSAEAIAASVYALMREQVRREGAASLGAIIPLATYISLVGFIGPQRALAVANGGCA